MMLHVVLVEPEIPPNTGNIIRLCANTGSTLHLVEPLGFSLDDAQLRRAGLDYRELTQVRRHQDLGACLATLRGGRVFPVETRGRTRYSDIRYQAGDALLFGGETSGLSAEVLSRFQPERVIRLPMVPGNRSLNLSNAAAVVVFEAWRQLRFEGGE